MKHAAMSLLCVVFALGSAQGHQGATGIVKERMDAMEALGVLTKAMAEKIKTNRNLASLSEDAAKIASVADRIPGWFPPGSGQPPTEASPAIWTDFASFQAKAAGLKTEAEALAAIVASGDPAPIAAQFRAVAAACKSCHEQFRVKPR